MACGILFPWSGIELMPPAAEVWNLSHWTAREVPVKASLLSPEQSLTLKDRRLGLKIPSFSWLSLSRYQLPSGSPPRVTSSEKKWYFCHSGNNQGFRSSVPGGASSKESACQCRRHERRGSIPESGRCPGEGRGNPIQARAWRIPWTEQPGGLQSMGLQTAGQDWVT